MCALRVLSVCFMGALCVIHCHTLALPVLWPQNVNKQHQGSIATKAVHLTLPGLKLFEIVPPKKKKSIAINYLVIKIKPGNKINGSQKPNTAPHYLSLSAGSCRLMQADEG